MIEISPVTHPGLQWGTMDQTLLNQRIEQWEKMTQEDPDNAMGWFSLGNAYRDAERNQESARALKKAIEMDEGLSRAYQILSQILIAEEANDQAAQYLTKGYVVAAERGDIMPMRAMESLLNKINHPVPEIKKVEDPSANLDADMILDRRTNQPGPKLDDPPMRGPVGQYIFEHYSQPTWTEWIGQGTKVINELRLDFSNVKHQEVYEQYMLEWLGVSMEEVEEFAKSKE